MMDTKFLATLLVVVVALLVAGLIAIREYRHYRKRKRRQQRVIDRGNETVYSMMGDMTVPGGADPEDDPIGNARIYLAYGDRKRALIVLEKAAAAHPEREDIRQLIAEIRALMASGASPGGRPP
jgi:Flp pilus assembly protein TadD